MAAIHIKSYKGWWWWWWRWWCWWCFVFDGQEFYFCFLKAWCAFNGFWEAVEIHAVDRV